MDNQYKEGMLEWYMRMVPAWVTALALILPLPLVAAYKCLSGEKLKPVCERVMKKYDSNEDGFLEHKEGIKMARALGYNETIPTNNAVFELNPFTGNTAILHIHTPDNYRGRHGWSTEIAVSSSKLEEAASGE